MKTLYKNRSQDGLFLMADSGLATKRKKSKSLAMINQDGNPLNNPDLAAEANGNISSILRVRQAPLKGKAIGFSQIYGNFISPALVAELPVETINHPDDYSGVIAHASLWNFEATESHGFMRILEDEPLQSPIFVTLRGTKLVNARPKLDPTDGSNKLFFTFHDLSVRIAGVYRIKITVFDSSGRIPSLVCFTEPFEIYTSSMYPSKDPMPVCSN